VRADIELCDEACSFDRERRHHTKLIDRHSSRSSLTNAFDPNSRFDRVAYDAITSVNLSVTSAETTGGISHV
jgi:hypothetical protein